MQVKDILVTQGAKESIEKAGGSVAPIEAKSVKEKFVKTSTNTAKKSFNKTEEAAAE
jgi:hypothetical protein